MTSTKGRLDGRGVKKMVGFSHQTTLALMAPHPTGRRANSTRICRGDMPPVAFRLRPARIITWPSTKAEAVQQLRGSYLQPPTPLPLACPPSALAWGGCEPDGKGHSRQALPETVFILYCCRRQWMRHGNARFSSRGLEIVGAAVPARAFYRGNNTGNRDACRFRGRAYDGLHHLHATEWKRVSTLRWESRC